VAKSLLMRCAAGGLVAVALALAVAVPCGATAASSDPDLELQLVYRPPTVAQSAAPSKGQRAFLEYSAVLLYENIRYWSTYGDWVEDWQYELKWDDQKRKLLELEGLRFDSNGFAINWTHAYAGGMYYSLGRVNNLGVKDSFLLAALESLYWRVSWSGARFSPSTIRS